MYQDIISNIFSKDMVFEKGLYIVATPIGNLNDITIRAIKILNSSDTIVCEDTRVSKKLFSHLGLQKKKNWLIYNDHSSDKDIKKILNELDKDKIISLISDAGTPLISDPGYKLLRRIRQSKHNIFSLPGPCSAIASLIISGLKTDKFCFLGFLHKNKNDYIGTIRNYTKLNYSIIIYEKSKRLNFFLATIKENFKYFKLAIVKELSKLHEDFFFITEENIDSFLKAPEIIRGELTIIAEFSNSNEKIYSDLEIINQLKKLKPSQVSAMLSKSSSQSRDVLYKRCMDLLNEKFFKK
ncbi:MAG: 16S rRNA (cytidine(1402)-2'-O)-methyltransferase [Pseudomonadota bacterium]|nr:16S rRNA (cytidine(1402)-2'-O)-methyltransferase [Pseudomonadota bacterium]